MIIVVEGIDRVGKTTLVNKIESLGFRTYKHNDKSKDYSKMTDDGETDTMLAMLWLLKLYPENNIIFDRFHISNTAYGILNRNYDKEKAFQNNKKIDKMLADLNAVLVYVEPADLERSNKEHGKDQSECLALTIKLFNNSAIPNKIICNYDSLDKVVEYICELEA